MSASKRPGRGVGRRLAVLSIGLIVALGAAELVLRAIHDQDPASLPAAMARHADSNAEVSGLPVLSSSRELSTPHIRGVFRGQLHRTDAYGFRGPDRPARAARGTRRVLVTGDSIAMGSGVTEAEAFPSVAESRLNEAGAAGEWEVINTAIAGANLATAIDRLEVGIAAYGGDVYVVPIMPNDIEGPDYVRLPAERTALDLIDEAGWPARSSSALVRVATWEWLDLWERIHELNMAHYSNEVSKNYFENPEAWRAFAAQLDRLARIGREHGRCVVVLLQTRLEALDPETHPYLPIYDKIARAARARGLHVVETSPAFLELDGEALRISQLDPHPNAAGHAVVGGLLAEGIRELPATCWRAEGG